MATITVYLENGFEHDRVTVGAGGDELDRADVSTRHQVGLATTVDLAVPDGAAQDGPVPVRVALPGRGLVAEAAVDPAATPHLRVDVVGGELQLRPVADPPRFA